MKNIEQHLLAYLESLIRNIPDFPKAGIQFKDITPLLQDADALHYITYLLAKPFFNKNIDYVAGLESRGFLFGPMLAKELNAGFVLMRKPGKLPAKTLSATYELEYGTDNIEMHADAIHKNDRVLIHDDLIATGGSAQAAGKLIQQCGGVVVGYSFIVAIAALKGIRKLQTDVKAETLLKL